MGFGTMNIWVRKEDCHIVDDRRAHLHIYDCHGHQVNPPTWFGGGHIEYKVPPGCYIVTAGVQWGNVYTDKTMVVVCCDQTVCVNLVLNRYKEEQAGERPPHRLLPIFRGCAARLLVPLFRNAGEINAGDLRVAAGVVLQAAGIDQEEMAEGLRQEAAFLRENRKEWADDPGDPGAYLKAIEQAAEALGGGKQQQR